VKVLGDRANKVDVRVISANNYSIALKETPPISCMFRTKDTPSVSLKKL